MKRKNEFFFVVWFRMKDFFKQMNDDIEYQYRVGAKYRNSKNLEVKIDRFRYQVIEIVNAGTALTYVKYYTLFQSPNLQFQFQNNQWNEKSAIIIRLRTTTRRNPFSSNWDFWTNLQPWLPRTAASTVESGDERTFLQLDGHRVII